MVTDVTFMGERAWIAQGWIKAGLIPATGGTLYVAKRGGQQAVWRLLQADRVDAKTAESWGLAIACENARDAALAMAEKITLFPRGPLLAQTSLSRNTHPENHLEEALEHQVEFLTSSEFEARAKALLK